MPYLKPERYADPESRDRSHPAGPWARNPVLLKNLDLVRLVMTLFLIPVLVLVTVAPTGAVEPDRGEPEPVLLRLKYATFDPLSAPPDIPAMPAGETAAGPYIVQFAGPVQPAWRMQLEHVGVQIVSYVPDYAFLVWMAPAAHDQVIALDTVRWVGPYLPAYKLSPDLDRERGLYRVILFPGTDPATVADRLQALDAVAGPVSGQKFALALPQGGVEEVASWPEVLWIENQPRYELFNNVAGGIMGAPQAWAAGYTGSGVTVTVCDSGIDSGVDVPTTPGDIHPDFDNRVAQIQSWPVQPIDFCINNVGADDGAVDLQSGHGTHVAGSVLGNGSASGGTIKGTAPEATLTFQAIEQWTAIKPVCGGGGFYALTGIPEDISLLFQEAYGWGSRIHTNSWGSDVAGRYTSDAAAVDGFVHQHPGMVILFSAGNAGIDANADGYVDEDSMGSPATAKNAITVGASDNERNTGGYAGYTWYTAWPFDYPVNPTRNDLISDDRGELAAFSSRGPTDDGRIKPDVVAPGTNILSTRSQYAIGSGWGPYNDWYMYAGGTSMATPLTAGAAALVREYYVEGLAHANPSAALIKATLINSAVDMPGYGNASEEAGQPIPNNHEGWGRVDVAAATSGDRKFEDGQAVATGNTQAYHYHLLGGSPLKISLVWSDREAAVTAGGLVSDLDLVVTAPGGTVYRGNDFANGWSLPGGTADRANNVENVYVEDAAAGEWIVSVVGHNVPLDPAQPFALVVTGSFEPPFPPDPPTLSPISNPGGKGNYYVEWSASTGATSYTLEEDDNGTFSSPTVVYIGPATRFTILGQDIGTWHYRVLASNAAGSSTWSASESVNVTVETEIHVTYLPLVTRDEPSGQYGSEGTDR